MRAGLFIETCCVIVWVRKELSASCNARSPSSPASEQQIRSDMVVSEGKYRRREAREMLLGAQMDLHQFEVERQAEGWVDAPRWIQSRYKSSFDRLLLAIQAAQQTNWLPATEGELEKNQPKFKAHFLAKNFFCAEMADMSGSSVAELFVGCEK